MREVSYFAPTDVGEAVKLLAEHGDKATILAGGTDLLPKINHYDLKPDVLLFIGGLGLNFVEEKDGKLVIGATTSTAQIAASEVVAEKAPALAEAARQSGSVAIRTSATIGGNIANASPAADLVAPLMAMDAEFKLVGGGGARVVPAKEFFVGPHKTAMKAGEMLTEVIIPSPRGKTVFVKLGRRHAQTLSVANAAVQLVMEGGICQDARIVLGAMAPKPLRCEKAEALLMGKVVDAALVDQCAEQAIAESSPINDQRATAWYRQKAGKVLVSRALAQAAGI